MTEHAVVIAGGGPKGLTLALAGVVAQVAQFFGIPLDSCGFPGQGETIRVRRRPPRHRAA